MSHFCEDVPLILVCTKIDLRSDEATRNLMSAQGTTPITHAEGEKVSREIKAKRYLECSAKQGTGVSEVFDAAVREALKNKTGVSRVIKKSKKCVIC